MTSQAASRQRSARLVISSSGAARWIASCPKIAAGLAADLPRGLDALAGHPAGERPRSRSRQRARHSRACGVELEPALCGSAVGCGRRHRRGAHRGESPRRQTSGVGHSVLPDGDRGLIELLHKLVLIHRAASLLPALHGHRSPDASSAQAPAILYGRNGISIATPKRPSRLGVRDTPFLAASLRLIDVQPVRLPGRLIGAMGSPIPVPARSASLSEHHRRGPDGGRVLVLNATYEPINVCTVRRAVVLLLKEKAEVVEQTERQLHSATTHADAARGDPAGDLRQGAA